MTGANAGEPRPARAAETDTLRRIVNEAYGHYIERMGKPPGPMLDDYSKRIEDGQAWVLETGGVIAGIVVLEADGQGALLLDTIAVAPSAQGQGIGRRLIAFTESEARRRNCQQVRLYTHVLMVENIALYNRLGFRETGRVSEKGFDRVYMAKHLE